MKSDEDSPTEDRQYARLTSELRRLIEGSTHKLLVAKAPAQGAGGRLVRIDQAAARDPRPTAAHRLANPRFVPPSAYGANAQRNFAAKAGVFILWELA
jgi:hypothetical protein